MQMERRKWPGESYLEVYCDDGIKWSATYIMQKAVELRDCVWLGVYMQEMVPDCAPEEVMEEGDFRKWDISRAIEWDITVNQPDGYVVGLVD